MMREIRCLMPQPGWTKVNIDGTARGQPGHSGCWGISRIYVGFSEGCFVVPLGAIFAEIMGFIVAVELAEQKGWFLLWIESDSTTLVSKVISKTLDSPWQIRVRWHKSLAIVSCNNFRISHVYRVIVSLISWLVLG